MNEAVAPSRESMRSRTPRRDSVDSAPRSNRSMTSSTPIPSTTSQIDMRFPKSGLLVPEANAPPQLTSSSSSSGRTSPAPIVITASDSDSETTLEATLQPKPHYNQDDSESFEEVQPWGTKKGGYLGFTYPRIRDSTTSHLPLYHRYMRQHEPRLEDIRLDYDDVKECGPKQLHPRKSFPN